MSNTDQFYLRRIVTTHGEHSYPQEQLSKEMYATLSTLPDAEGILKMVGFIYDHSKIRQRHFEFDLAEVKARSDWYRVVNEASHSMAVRALKNLFAEQDITPADCDGFIVVSSTHNGFPGLSRKLQGRFGFPLEAVCYDLGSFGCAGGPPALYLAQMLLENKRCRNICIVCVEALGTHTQSRKYTKAPTMSQLVGHGIVSDAAVAMILSREPGPQPRFSYRSCSLSSRYWTDSLDINVLSASDDNQPYISVGKEIQTRLLSELSHFVNEEFLTSPIFLHPGGIALMRQVADKFPQLAKTVALSIADLEDFGNLGSTSVLWVLKRALDAKAQITPRMRLVTFGPGKVTSVALFDGVEAGA